MYIYQPLFSHLAADCTAQLYSTDQRRIEPLDSTSWMLMEIGLTNCMSTSFLNEHLERQREAEAGLEGGNYMSQKVDTEPAINICPESLLIRSGCHALLVFDPVGCILYNPLQP